MADLIDQAFDLIRAKLTSAMKVGGQHAEEDIAKAISVPVGRDFAGNPNVRSAPGRPPRLDTGQLHGNVEHTIISTDNSVGFVVASSRPDTPDVPRDLEEGSARVAPRPYMVPARERFRNGGKNVVIEALKA